MVGFIWLALPSIALANICQLAAKVLFKQNMKAIENIEAASYAKRKIKRQKQLFIISFS